MPLSLKDRLSRRDLATLADARVLILGLSDRHPRNPRWRYAAELMMAAARDKASGRAGCTCRLRVGGVRVARLIGPETSLTLA